MSQDPAHILIVDDDTRLRDLLNRFLGEQGFRVTTAGSAAEARVALSAIAFDLWVVDVMMPGETGCELTRALRSTLEVPILLLTAMGETEQRIEGLAVGADDYLAKPFEPRELVLRINAILRRQRPAASPKAQGIAFGDFHFDPARGELTSNGEAIHLTAAERGLLRVLARQPRVPVARDLLAIETDQSGSARAIDVQITRLRRKIEEDPRYPRFLQTVRGTGYVLIPD